MIELVVHNVMLTLGWNHATNERNKTDSVMYWICCAVLPQHLKWTEGCDVEARERHRGRR